MKSSFFKRVVALIVASMLFFFNQPAIAKKETNLSIIRDAEIEALLQDYSSPILKAAKLSNGAVEIYLLNNPEFNAFVTSGRMFINTGLLLKTKTPNEVIGIIAHEAAHLAGGHQHRIHDQIASAEAISIITTLLGVGIAAAASKKSNRDFSESVTQGATGIVLAGRHIANRYLLQYLRSEERSADRAAITLLEKTGQSAKGFLDVMTQLQQNLFFSSQQIDPYLQTHPLAQERINSLREVVRKKNKHFNKKDSLSLQNRHDMMRGKIAAYTVGMSEVQRIFHKREKSIGFRYGRAIATYLYSDPKAALSKINQLIKEMPSNPYFYEMKSEILLRSTKVYDAISPMRQAIKLDKRRTGLFRIQLGHILLETGDKKLLSSAVQYLKSGLLEDPKSAEGFGHLARAYDKQGKKALALAASSERMFIIGNYDAAKKFALRARVKLKRESPEWLRIQDIINYKPLQ